MDRALAGGASISALAAEHGVSRQALLRHRESHLAASLASEVAAQPGGGAVVEVTREVTRRSVPGAGDLLAKIASYEADAQRLAVAAEAAGRYQDAVAAVRALTKIVELQTKLAGEIMERQRAAFRVEIDGEDWAELDDAELGRRFLAAARELGA